MNAPAPVAPAAPSPVRPFDIKRLRLADTLGFRRLALGSDSPPDVPRPETDDDQGICHIGLVGPYEPRDQEHRILACVTYVFEPYNGPDGKELAWRMYGLASLRAPAVPQIRTSLLVPAERMVAEDSRIHTFWSRARLMDRPLLEKLGWTAVIRSAMPYAEGIRFLMLKRWSPAMSRN